MPEQLRHAYLVCATPRCGSTLLCEMLRETGQAGRPVEHFEILRHSSLPRQPREYFLELDSADVLALLPPAHAGHPSNEAPGQWWDRVISDGTTANGVWGGKLMWDHVEDFLSRARELPGLAKADLQTALKLLLKDPQLVLVSRQDKAAQAVSLWRAVQTRAWRADDFAHAGDPVYSFGGIDHLRRRLEAGEAAWRSWLAGAGLEAIEVTYENLDRDPKAVAEGVLEALELGDAQVKAPRLSRQRDELSSAWVERYLHDLQRAA